MLLISVLFCSCFGFIPASSLSGITALNWMTQHHPFLADIIIQTVSQISRSDSQNFVFVLTTVLLDCSSLTSLRCYNLPALWLDKLIRSSFRQPSLNYYAGYFLFVCWYYDLQLAFLTVTTLSDLGSFWLPQHNYLVPGGWFFPFLPNLTCGIFGQTDLFSKLSTL